MYVGVRACAHLCVSVYVIVHAYARKSRLHAFIFLC